MKYLLCSDYDGTLLQSGKISEDTSNAIKEFRAGGNFFAIVTGRGYATGYMQFKNSDEFSFDYVINSNGACACDNKGNVVFSKDMCDAFPSEKTKLVEPLIRRCLELTNNPFAVSDEKVMWWFCQNEFNTSDRYSSAADIKKIQKLTSLHLSFNTKEEASKSSNILREEFGPYINPILNGFSLDVAPAGVDKATGIQDLIKIIGVDKDCVWSVGDNYNDISMIQRFHGCAIKSGVDDLKKNAEYVCESVGDVIGIILQK